jgi:hypothetical protein
MGEIENLGGVLRSIRLAVPEGDRQRPLIDGLIEGVGVPEATGGGRSLDAALAGLARSRPPPELAYPRVQVLTALLVALPDRCRPEGKDGPNVVAAMRPVTRDGNQRRAEAAHALMWDQASQEQDAHEIKRAVFATGLGERVLDLVVEDWTAIVSSPAGNSRVRLGATAHIPGFRVKDVAALLDPTTWSELSDRRITMTRREHGKLKGTDGVIRRYDDYDEIFVVSDRLKLTPRLRVIRHAPVKTGGEAAEWLEYRMADSQSAGEIVRVDQGSIVIRSVADSVRVETTKRVLLTPPFDGAGLALHAELLGYFDAFEQMVRAAVEKAAKKAAKKAA